MKNKIQLIKDEITLLNQKHNDMIDREKIFNKYKTIKELDRSVLDDFIEKIYMVQQTRKRMNEKSILYGLYKLVHTRLV